MNSPAMFTECRYHGARRPATRGWRSFAHHHGVRWLTHKWRCLTHLDHWLALGVVIGGCSGAAADPKAPAVDTLPRVAATHINFVTLQVADMPRAVRFYTEALGMHERGRGQPDTRFFEVVMGYDDDPSSAAVSLTYRDGAPNPQGNGSSSVNLVVTDLAALLGRVVRLGGVISTALQRVTTPNVDYGIARIKDPDGNSLELVEYHRIAPR